MRGHTSIAIAAALAIAVGANAGSLEPPGPPAPTMLTLEEIPGRIPIRASDLPLLIVDPGSYYLVEDAILEPSNDGIFIVASNVTIDLNGHTLSTTEATGGVSGIRAAFSILTDLTVKNGTIAGWDKGVELYDRAHVSNVVARGNLTGIQVGAHSLVSDVQAGWVSFTFGVGITAGRDSVIRDCVVADVVDGIYAGDNSLIKNCSVAAGNGIILGSGSSAIENTVNSIYNGGAIQVHGDGNALLRNTVTDGNAGISVYGTYNRIDGNHVYDSGIGILVSGTGNTVVRNSSMQNATNYSIGAGNDVGPIGPLATATSPWANCGGGT